MGYRYAILGAGRQGVSAGYDIGRFGDAEEICLYDLNENAAKKGADKINRLLNSNIAKGFPLDVRDESALLKALKGIDSTVSAVPYMFNLPITEAAIKSGSSLCDLGGHTETVRKQLALHDQAKSAGVTVTPDCGMGPGLNISMGVYAMSLVDEPQEVFIWDGGLPLNPKPPWNYISTFHINGLTNEYFGDAVFLRDGKVTPIPCLTEVETLEFPSPLGKLEAAVTSGGLSTMPWTFEGKLKKLENKTLRYPGHWQQFQAFKELGLFELDPKKADGKEFIPREIFHTLLKPKISADSIKDICVIRVQCNGREKSCTLELVEKFDEATGFTAMEKLTGWHASMVAILSAKGEIERGAVPIEKALPGELLASESAKRNWEIQKVSL